jgi:hypothetical protein
MSRGCGQCDKIAFGALPGRQFARGIEDGIDHRTDVRLNSLQVAQHIEMQRGGLGPALAQTIEMPFGGGKLGVAQQRLLREKLAGLIALRHCGNEQDRHAING